MSEERLPRALVVDDEPELRTLVSFALSSQGFSVDTAADADQAWLRLRDGGYDIVLLDVVMPGDSGIDLCRRIRAELDLPVIMLTALGDTDHRVIGLEAGADDYVAKPFNPRELALRAQALHRRSRRAQVPELVNGPLVVRPATRRVSYHGREVHLSESEFRICAMLAQRCGDAVRHRELVDAVWGHDESLGGREMLKTTVWRLRWKLGQVDRGTLIESVRGVGYRMVRMPLKG